MSVICPICGGADLQARVVVETIQYGGQDLQVPGIAVSYCESCRQEFVTPEQTRANVRVFADAKRVHDGLLPSEAIVTWRKALGLTQSDAARLLGGGANAFSKYERGEVLQSKAMDLLIRVTGSVPQTHAILRARAGLVSDAKVTKTFHVKDVASSWSRSSSVMVGEVIPISRARLAANDDHGKWEISEVRHAHR